MEIAREKCDGCPFKGADFHCNNVSNYLSAYYNFKMQAYKKMGKTFFEIPSFCPVALEEQLQKSEQEFNEKLKKP